MIEGFYAFYYTGTAGSGFGILVLKNGMMAGADSAGVFYDGEYQSNHETGTLEGTMRMTVAPGVPLVTGASSSPQSYTVEFPVSLPSDLTAKGPTLIQTPTGPVNINFRKLRDYPTDPNIKI